MALLMAHPVAGSLVDRASIARPAANDPINPAHYTQGWSDGAQVIDITENLNYNRGNAVKYLARAGVKDVDRELEDLRKAAWHVNREIARLQA